MARASEVYRIYMQSPEWAERRKAKLTEAGYHCERCPSRERLEVHHRSYQNFGRERMEELEVLCHDCHAAEHGEDWDGALPIAGPSLRDFAHTAAVTTASGTHRVMAELLEEIGAALARSRPELAGMDAACRRHIEWFERRHRKMVRDFMGSA